MIPHPLPAKPKPAITNSKQKSSGTIASFLPAKPPGILSQSRSAKTKTSGVHIAIPQTADIQTVFIQQKSAKTPISQVRITAIESSNTLNPSPAAPANNATASSFFKRDPFPPPSPDTFPKPVNHESRPLSMQHFPKIVAPDGTVAVLSVSDDPTYIHGPFSIREQQAVKAAVYKFLDTYGMVDSDLHDLLHVKTRSARWPNINRTFWAEVLANSGVNRSVNQVYKHVKSILSNDNRRDSDKYLLARRDYTRWTHEEDVKLLDAVAFYGSEGFWKKIELELGRVGVRERYRLLQNSNDSSKSHGTWTVAEEAALLSTMLEHHKPKTADEKPEASTWLQVMNAIPTRSLISIRLKWKVQIWLTWKAAIERQATTSELSEPKSIEWKYGSDDFNLLKSLKKNFKGAFDASDIRWSQIPGFEA
ncbi:RNA polymerase I enhancer binding protein, partial [Physocladia obscura]